MTSRFITLKQILKTNISIIKRCKFNKIAKKALSITIIVLTLFTQMPANNNVYADEIAKPSAYTLMYNTTYENTELNFENELLKAQVIDWEKANTLIKKGETFKVIDPKTKTTINLKRTGGHNHMDVETLTKADTDKLKMVWGGFSWEKKGMVLVTENGNSYIVSMHSMPHAGTDSKPGGTTVKFRSQGYGSGTNWDFVKDNGMNGHICIHFKGSKTHGTQKVVYKHQYEIDKLNQQKKDLFNSLFESI